MTNERLMEIALGDEASKEEMEEMAMKLLNWYKEDEKERQNVEDSDGKDNLI